jgi:hypothetical protein
MAYSESNIIAVRLARSTLPSLAFGGQVPISVHAEVCICKEEEKKWIHKEVWEKGSGRRRLEGEGVEQMRKTYRELRKKLSGSRKREPRLVLRPPPGQGG